MPRWFRKACRLPLPPRHIAASHSCRQWCQLQSAAAEHRDVRRRYAAYLSQVQPACRLRVPRLCFGPALLSQVQRAWCAPENLDTEQPLSYRYEFTNPASLGKRRYAHTAADLHVRSRFSNRASLEEPLNAASDLITTPWCSSDNHRILRGRWLFRSVATLHARARKPIRWIVVQIPACDKFGRTRKNNSQNFHVRHLARRFSKWVRALCG